MHRTTVYLEQGFHAGFFRVSTAPPFGLVPSLLVPHLKPEPSSHSLEIFAQDIRRIILSMHNALHAKHLN
jgi:hypothetical protein